MSQIRKISFMVEQVLKDNPDTRNDDNKLIACLMARYYPSASKLPLADIGNTEIYVPSFESIRRARQKIQENNEDLRGTISCRQRRKLHEEEMKGWALNG